MLTLLVFLDSFHLSAYDINQAQWFNLNEQVSNPALWDSFDDSPNVLDFTPEIVVNRLRLSVFQVEIDHRP